MSGCGRPAQEAAPPAAAAQAGTQPEAQQALQPATPSTTVLARDPRPNDSAAAAPTREPDQPSLLEQVRTYDVESGDSVRSIARQFGITNETIIWANDLADPDLLVPGQKLLILPFTGFIHEVRPGDTVASIANAYDARVDAVIRANRLGPPYIIVVGQRLAVPGGYRPLPQKVVPIADPEPGRAAPAAAEERDSVRAPQSPGDQQVATIAPPARKLPVLGNTPQERFIGAIADAAVDSMERSGVPASVTIAQAILESYWGSSRLAQEANNYFGIKAQTRPGPAGVMWLDVWEVMGGRNVVRSEPFRRYASVAESFVDHGRFFLENQRYAAALAAREDPRQFAREIARAGYATDPAYAGKLISLMDRYDLYRFESE